jgi:enoyl-CoA hydratase/carnithine racemase
MGTLVQYATDKGVALITLTDPPANAFSHEMFKELDSCVLEARFDDDVHVLVVTGHGDKYFSAGANVNMLKEADETFKYYFALHANETLLRLENTPKLVLAAINGHAIGGGLELALACDMRVARGGHQVGLPEVGMGILPATGGTQRLARTVGKARAMELLIEGQPLSGDDALAIGLVHKTWDTESHEAFMRRILEYAHEFCPPGRASATVGALKRAAQAAGETSLEQGIALERELQARVLSTGDAKEGLAASVQKRKPVFRGR